MPEISDACRRGSAHPGGLFGAFHVFAGTGIHDDALTRFDERRHVHLERVADVLSEEKRCQIHPIAYVSVSKKAPYLTIGNRTTTKVTPAHAYLRQRLDPASIAYRT